MRSHAWHGHRRGATEVPEASPEPPIAEPQFTAPATAKPMLPARRNRNVRTKINLPTHGASAYRKRKPGSNRNGLSSHPTHDQARQPAATLDGAA